MYDRDTKIESFPMRMREMLPRPSRFKGGVALL